MEKHSVLQSRGDLSIETLVGIVLVLMGAAVIFMMIQGNVSRMTQWLNW